jgi:hypothetical protein
LRHHLGLVWRTPFILYEASKGWTTFTTVLFFYLLFNKKIAAWGYGVIGTVSPWWALAPVGILFLFGLMQANYEAFTKVEQRADGAEAENKRLAAQLDGKAKRKAVKDLLGVAVEQGESLRGDMRRVGSDFRFNTMDDVEDWVHRTHDLIEAAFDKGEARRFLDRSDYTPENPLATEEVPVVDTYGHHLEPRLRRLQELIVRANAFEINDSFYPRYWMDRFNLG